MTEKIVLLVAGALIGLLSSLITTFVNAYLQNLRQEKDWERQTLRRKEDLQREELKSIQKIVAKDQIERISKKSQITTLRSPPFACIANDTQVTMADKSRASVQKLRAGDVLLAYDHRSRSFDQCKVKSIAHVTVHRSILINGRLRVSESHQVYTTEGGVRAKELRIGIFIIREDNSAEEVTKIELSTSPIEVYAITLYESSTFFAEGFCVLDYVSKQVDTGEERTSHGFNKEEVVEIAANGEIIESIKD